MKTQKMSRQRENRNVRLLGLMEMEERSLLYEIEEAEKKFRESIATGCFDTAGSEMEEWSIRADYYRRRLRLVQECLFRLESGEFGICTSCNEEISDKRLKAVPTAIYCLECQQQMECERTPVFAVQ